MKVIKVIIQILIVLVPFVLNICTFGPLINLTKGNYLFFFWTAILTAAMVFMLEYFSSLFGEWFDSKLK